MARRMIVMIKAPKARGWLISGEEDDEVGAVARFLPEDPVKGDDTLREYLGLEEDAKLPTQVEVKTTDLYYRRLLIQAIWK